MSLFADRMGESASLLTDAAGDDIVFHRAGGGDTETKALVTEIEPGDFGEPGVKVLRVEIPRAVVETVAARRDSITWRHNGRRYAIDDVLDDTDGWHTVICHG